MKVLPTLEREQRLWASGTGLVAGVDEVGRGPLAGPVVAAAVIFSPEMDTSAAWLPLVRDSKLLSHGQRCHALEHVQAHALAISIGVCSSQEIDRLNIAKATRVAMAQAIQNLSTRPEHVLVDYFELDCGIRCTGVKEGDSLCFSIAAASIVAKVFRDRLMGEMDKCYPGYAFCLHKGYCTKLHLERLYRLGPSSIHRLSFRPVRDALARQAG